MKKLMIFGLLISLFAFWGSKNEVNTAHAEEVAQETGTSATFFDESIYKSLNPYSDNIISMKISNNAADLPLEKDYVCNPIPMPNCTYTDTSGNETIPEEGVIFAYLSYASDSTETNKRYNCVLYADVDIIYANYKTHDMFSNFLNLEELDIKMLNTSKTTLMVSMFYNCPSLTKLDLSNLDTSNVTSMMTLFANCSSLTELDLTSFNTSNVKNMDSIFAGCSSLTQLNLSSFNTSSVTGSLASMFAGCSSLTELDLSNFNTSNVTYMNGMFSECLSLTELDLSNFNTSSVTNMSYMFNGCSSLTQVNLSGFNTSNVKNMSGMFSGCTSLTQLDLSNFKTSGVNNMKSMFKNCSSITELNVLSFDTKYVRNAEEMFNGCVSLKKLNVSSFDLGRSCRDSSNGLVDFLSDCINLEYFKSPKALPTSSLYNKHFINLPSQFTDYYGVTTLTNENLSQYPVFNIPGEKFIRDWQTLRTEGGDNGICAAIPSSSTGNAKLTQLLTDYDSFDAETKTYVNKTTDKDNVTVGESVTYVKNVLNGTQTTEKDYGISKEDAGSYMTMGITEESSYLIAIIALLGVLAIIAYYFYNKKRQAI